MDCCGELMVRRGFFGKFVIFWDGVNSTSCMGLVVVNIDAKLSLCHRVILWRWLWGPK